MPSIAIRDNCSHDAEDADKDIRGPRHKLMPLHDGQRRVDQKPNYPDRTRPGDYGAARTDEQRQTNSRRGDTKGYRHYPLPHINSKDDGDDHGKDVCDKPEHSGQLRSVHPHPSYVILSTDGAPSVESESLRC